MTSFSARLAETSGGLLLFAALLLGGASQGNAASLAVVELLALPALSVGVWLLCKQGLPAKAGLPLAILAAVVLLPLVQLIPLPPGVWTALPDRAGVLGVLRTAGLPLGSMPISLTPEATVHSALTLVAPAGLFLITLQLAARARTRLVVIALVAALVSVFLGLLQVAGGPASALRFYADTSVDSAVGFFANRDHQADFLACAIPLAAAVLALIHAARTPLAQFATAPALALIAILVMGVAVTASRAGVVLAVIGLFGGLVLTRVLGGRRLGLGLAVAIGLLILVAIGAGRVPGLSRFAERGQDQDLRFTAAPTVFSLVRSYWPIGSGVGSFIPIYQTVQPTALVDPTIFNHAHDDFLEVSLEGGVAAWVIFAAFLAWFALRCRDTWRRGGAAGGAVLARAGSIVVMMVLLHSTVDYPLRTLAMSTLFALACGLMTDPPAPEMDPDWSSPHEAL